MSKYVQILTKYWGHSVFRELQEDIILSVASGKDTLALMPTGGGKSITFQVPAIAMPGLCLVISPLIALMKDQVENLKKHGIKALAVYSGMTGHEINIAYDNCAYGDYKFLYLSPERIATPMFLERIKHFDVNIIAVDEAHCISQWGYDFRPSYLRIAELRKHIPGVPVLALTATATPKVVNDIQEKLLFQEKNVLQKSYGRSNLAYVVRETEDKLKYLLKIISKVPGTGIVYLRSRKGTREISEFLKNNKINADYYHAGISVKVRSQRQEDWKSGRIRIMVATNAFGMGIDKDNVRFVVHMDFADSLEAYFQEAGRAGRDGKKAYAVLLANTSDETKLKRHFTKSFPSRDIIRKVYQALGNYFSIPIEGGKGMAYDFDLFDFTKKFNLDYVQAYNCLKILTHEGYIEVTDELNQASRVIFLVGRDQLYKFQVANAQYDKLIKVLLRSYTGLFNDYVKIDENLLAKRIGTNRDTVYEIMKNLSKSKIINFIPSKQTALVIYTVERLNDQSLFISRDNYEKKKQVFQERINAVLHYAFSTHKCRSQLLLEYFGEKTSDRCGKCDYCQRRNELNLSTYEFDEIFASVKKLLLQKPMRLEDLIGQVNQKHEKVVKVIRWLFDNKKIQYRPNKSIEWTESLF
ncbi:MAG: ATP-dependent DNA helicase RecQ [Bacteroidota bacterium]|nr:ATP-dependent DNA helicase RecQ [Bacteroidota bacterium]